MFVFKVDLKKISIFGKNFLLPVLKLVHFFLSLSTNNQFIRMAMYMSDFLLNYDNKLGNRLPSDGFVSRNLPIDVNL